MRRREFITMLGGAAIWPLAARAQQPIGKRRVSILLPYAEVDAEIQTWMASFVQALRELGWIDGSNVQIDTHWTATGDVGRNNQAAMEVIDRKPDVILANGPLAVASLKQVTSTIPIVFVSVADPVGSGFVASLARPGGNITGFTLGEFTMSGKMPEILKKIAPHVARVTVIYNPQQIPQVGRLAAVQMAAATLGLQVSAASVVTAEEIKHAIEKLDGEPDRGVIVMPAPVTITNRNLIIALLARYRLPAVYEVPVFARDGGLVAYGTDRVVQFRQAATYVDRILRGEKPADLPIQDPTKFALIVNLKTAKALGLTVPESLLATADEVIE